MPSVHDTSPSSILQWTELAIFTIAGAVISFNVIIHGLHGLLGWWFLLNFCAIRVVAFIMLRLAQDPIVLRVASILSSVALSGLFFGIFGVWHECSFTVKKMRPFLFGWVMQIILHLVVAMAIGLVAAGGAIFSQEASRLDNDPGTRGLFVAGAIVIFVCWLFFCTLVWALWITPGRLMLETRLLRAVAICTFLLGLRTLYSLLAAAINDQSWNILSGGPFVAAIILQVIPELLIVVILAIAGCSTLKLVTERRGLRRSQRNAQNVQLAQYHVDEEIRW